MIESTTGIVPRILEHLFGERAGRLTERATRAHWLSYPLVLSQSIAVVLVLGHAELPLLLGGSLAIRAMASMGVFVLVATAFASDLALLETLRRIPVLARNRQRAAHREHLLYVGFVLLVEASTYAVVMATLDRNPQALISDAPLVPASGPLFVAQVVLRAVLVCWTAVQLVIVRGRLPVLLSTLTGTGKEIVGAHVERQLAALDIHGVTLPDTFRLYVAMARPPRRIRTLFNGWLADREIAAEAEEERQVTNVVDALEELERRRTRATVVEAAPPAQPLPQPQYTPPPLEAFAIDWDDHTRPPTGGGSPAAARPVRTPRKERPAVLRLAVPSEAREAAAQARAGRANTRRVRTPKASVEEKARAAWQPGMSVGELERAAGISRSAAGKYRRTFMGEAQAQADAAEVNAGQVAQ